MMVMSQLTLMLVAWAMHMMAPMMSAQMTTAMRDTITRRLPGAVGLM